MRLCRLRILLLLGILRKLRSERMEFRTLLGGGDSGEPSRRMSTSLRVKKSADLPIALNYKQHFCNIKFMDGSY